MEDHQNELSVENGKFKKSNSEEKLLSSKNSPLRIIPPVTSSSLSGFNSAGSFFEDHLDRDDESCSVGNLDWLEDIFSSASALANGKREFWRGRSKELRDISSQLLKNAIGESELRSSQFNLKNKKNELLSIDWDQLHRAIESRIEDLVVSLTEDTKIVNWTERFSFFSGVILSCGTPLLASSYPKLLPHAYSAVLVSLVSTRFIYYRVKKWHYFLFDICYFVNLMLVIYIYYLPQSVRLLQSIYCLSFGPILFAVIAWRNSLVFHSLDKLTSVYIHLFPPLVLFTLKWNLDPHDQLELYPAIHKLSGQVLTPSAYCSWIINSLIVYWTWQVCYLGFVIGRNRERVSPEDRRMTAYQYLVVNETRQTLIKRFSVMFGSRHQSKGFLLLQFLYALGSQLPAPFTFNSYSLSLSFLVFFFSASVWSGGTYYADVFSQYYETKLRSSLEKKKKDGSCNLKNLIVKTSRRQTGSSLSSPDQMVSFSDLEESTTREKQIKKNNESEK